MPKQNQMQMPGVFGGLMRYDEEYASRFMISPIAIIGFIIAIIIIVLALKIFFPIASLSGGTGVVPGVPGGHRFILSLLGF